MRIFLSLIILGFPFLTACGVKGKPLPPLTAPNIGRGKPTFTGRNEKVPLEELNRKREYEDSDSELQKRDDSN